MPLRALLLLVLLACPLPCVGVAWARSSLAEALPQSPPISFGEALRHAALAPAATAPQKALAVRRQLDARIPALSGNPQLNVQAGYRALSEPERGAEVQITLTQPVNLAGYAGARRRAAAAEEQVLGAEAGAASLAQRLRCASTWLALWGAQQALEEARKEVGLAIQFTRQTERAAVAQLLTRAESTEAAAYQAEAELLALSLEGEVFELGVELARLVAAPAPGPLRAAGPLPELDVPPQEAQPQLLARAAALPEVAQRRLAEIAERAREAEVRASRGLQAQLGAYFAREAPAAIIAMGVVNISAPLFDRGQRERAALLAEAARLQGEAEAQATSARAALVLAFHDVAHSGEVYHQLREHLVPAAAEGARLRELSQRAGESTVLELLLSRRAAALARGRLARAQAEHAQARARLSLLASELKEAAP